MPPAATLTLPSVSVAVPPTASLLAVPSPLALTGKIEILAKVTLPVTRQGTERSPVHCAGANLPPLMTSTLPVIVP